MLGVTGSVIGVLDDSPFSDFVTNLFIFLLGAMEMVFESLKERSENDGFESKSKSETIDVSK